MASAPVSPGSAVKQLNNSVKVATNSLKYRTEAAQFPEVDPNLKLDALNPPGTNLVEVL